MSLKIICGKPGCGKSYQLIKLYRTLKKRTKILSLTHSNIANLKEIAQENNPGSDLDISTIHNFFGINIKTNTQFQRTECDYRTLLIDEYSQVPRKVLKVILSYKNQVEEIIFFGDLLQLNPIQDNYLTPKFTTCLDNLELTTKEILTVCHKLANSNMNQKGLKSAARLILTKNFRSESDVFDTYKRALKREIYIIDAEKLKNLVDQGYHVISSRFKHLKYVNQLTSSRGEKILTRIGEYNLGSKFRMLTKVGSLENNQLVEIVEKPSGLKLDGKISIEGNHLNICPEKFITVHRSQGMSLDKIVVVLDDFYSCDFFSTSVFRARKDCRFFICDSNKERVLENIFTMNKCFEICDEIIYPTIK